MWEALHAYGSGTQHESLFAGVRWPETVAAVALLIQAVILLLQTKILHRHGETMEQQARTGELIGQALDQQSKVLAEQTKIADAQFKFQQRIEAKSEREKVFEAILDLHSRFVALMSELSTGAPSSGTTIHDLAKQQQVEQMWSRLEQSILPAQKLLITAIHLSHAEKDYFWNYAQALDALTRKEPTNATENLKDMQAISETYKDFAKRLGAAARGSV